MTNLEQQFFELLRCGLWNSPVEDGFFSEATDWESILTLANKQTVTGIIFDGVEKLPPEKQPSAKVMRKLYHTVIRIEQSHELLNQQLGDIVAMLQSNGIRSVLLKGQGVALNYPNPLRRQCGDIDLYIGEENYKRACDIVMGEDTVTDHAIESEKHLHVRRNEVDLELHRVADKLFHPKLDRKFRSWSKQQLEGTGVRTWSMNGVEVILPPPHFDVLFIFNHAFKHFISGGISLRQLCDWTLYLHTFNKEIDQSELLETLKSFRLLRGWKVFGYIAVNELGLPKDEFPFYTEKYKHIAEGLVLKSILCGGNFGFYAPHFKRRPKRYLLRKIHSMVRVQKRLFHLFRLSPSNVSAYFVHHWSHGIKNVLKGI